MARTTRVPLTLEQAKVRLRETDPMSRAGRLASLAGEAVRSRPLSGLACALGIGFVLGASPSARAGLLGALASWVRRRGRL